ncbi:helix-turn-helix transcriptional regulator [Acetobacterium sp.]|uniref:helix-turn-helix domain-containing protein n=1 Tax=Acetobacterium sp. TaxID=1872094 RepID=UPI00271B5FAB|nr:helix-turn-helix transcriptional regulator [Acetobacterium sp.]MDO9491098.1 helix-turn-helix transcriptional regulator [Acetobacterium sp.]
MGMTEKIKIAMLKRNMSLNDLAEKIGQSPQNISGKFKRDNFKEDELKDIATALGCTVNIELIMEDTGEKL